MVILRTGHWQWVNTQDLTLFKSLPPSYIQFTFGVGSVKIPSHPLHMQVLNNVEWKKEVFLGNFCFTFI